MGLDTSPFRWEGLLVLDVRGGGLADGAAGVCRSGTHCVLSLRVYVWSMQAMQECGLKGEVVLGASLRRMRGCCVVDRDVDGARGVGRVAQSRRQRSAGGPAARWL